MSVCACVCTLVPACASVICSISAVEPLHSGCHQDS